MQQSFISKVLEEVWQEGQNLENTTFVLPSRRACTFLKNSIAQKTKRNIFAPQIYSIEQFIELLANMSYASLTEQLFVLYKAYLQLGNDNKEGFYDFSRWARTLLSDFDEIDRYLIPHKKIFSYLSAITEVNHWYVQKERTPVMEDYIKFWNSLEPLYRSFSDLLIEQGKGHQGLVYRTALQRLPEYLETTKGRKHIFLGFNALNKAESEIIQCILETGASEIYWDLDQYFLDESYHDAGYFIRRHKKRWKYFEKHRLNGIGEDFLSPKNIQIIGVPKNVSQVKYIGALLGRLSDDNLNQLSDTALVLGDESLLNPLLNALPPQLDRANITMGYPLKGTPLAGLFNQFFDLYLHQDPRGWHHKKLMSFLSLPYFQLLISEQEKEGYS
ncbi:MAG: PD-(D/E)XK nuclease family protein, partial [Flavobacteriaceae bacterium]